MQKKQYCECCGYCYKTEAEYKQDAKKADVSPILIKIDDEVCKRLASNTLLNIDNSEYMRMVPHCFIGKDFGLRTTDLYDDTEGLTALHHGDILVGFVATEDVYFIVSFGGAQIFEHSMKSGTFNYALNNTCMVAIIGLQYHNIVFSPESVKDKIKLVYASIDGKERIKLAQCASYYKLNSNKYIKQKDGYMLQGTHDILEDEEAHTVFEDMTKRTFSPNTVPGVLQYIS